MKSKICAHCDEIIRGKAYRVTSEEDGVMLLNMIVCTPCAAEAKTLQLATAEITPEHDGIPMAHRAASSATTRLVALKSFR